MHLVVASELSSLIFFFNDTATTEIYTLSLHDALPISCWTAACSRSVPSGRLGDAVNGRAGAWSRTVETTRVASIMSIATLRGGIDYEVNLHHPPQTSTTLRSSFSRAGGPSLRCGGSARSGRSLRRTRRRPSSSAPQRDRKSTRLNSSHSQ